MIDVLATLPLHLSREHRPPSDHLTYWHPTSIMFLVTASPISLAATLLMPFAILIEVARHLNKSLSND